MQSHVKSLFFALGFCLALIFSSPCESQGKTLQSQKSLNELASIFFIAQRSFSDEKIVRNPEEKLEAYMLRLTSQQVGEPKPEYEARLKRYLSSLSKAVDEVKLYRTDDVMKDKSVKNLGYWRAVRKSIADLPVRLGHLRVETSHAISGKNAKFAEEMTLVYRDLKSGYETLRDVKP